MTVLKSHRPIHWSDLFVRLHTPPEQCRAPGVTVIPMMANAQTLAAPNVLQLTTEQAGSQAVGYLGTFHLL